MGSKAGEKIPYPIGSKQQTDNLLLQGRSVFASRTMITSNFEDLSNLTAEQIPLPTSDVAMEIVSDSTDDNFSGTGARTILVVSLDDDFVETISIFELGGVTPQNVITNSGSGVRRINTFLVQSVGTIRGAATGTIVIRDKNNPSIIYSQIDPGENSSAQTLFTVPENTQVSFAGWYASASTIVKTIEFRLQTTFNQQDDINVPGIFTTRDKMTLREQGLYKGFSIPVVLPTRADIIINAKVLGGGNGTGEASYQFFIQRS